MADENIQPIKKIRLDQDTEIGSSSLCSTSKPQDNTSSTFNLVSLNNSDSLWWEDSDQILKNFDYYMITNEFNDLFPLHTAVKKKKYSRILQILKNGFDIDAPSLDGDTALHIAVKMQNWSIVKCLLKYGANPFAKTIFNHKMGYTALHLAAEFNSEDIIELLMTKRPNFTISSNMMRKRCLRFALLRRSIKIVKHLLKDVNPSSIKNQRIKSLMFAEEESTIDPVNEIGETPLFIAVRQGNLKICKTLLKMGGKLDVMAEYRDFGLCTVFHVATDINRKDIMIHLLNCGAYVNSFTERYLNALHIAVLNDNLDLIETLLNWGLETNIKGFIKEDREGDPKGIKRGLTPLHIAILNRNMKIIKFLMNSKNIDINATDGYNNSVLYVAVREQLIEAIKCLLEFGNIDINYHNSRRGYTALHLAMEMDHQEIINLLLEHGANVHATTPQGISSVHFAAASPNIFAIQNYLNFGVDINLPTRDKAWTPLHIAVKNKRVEVVSFLLKNGADVDALTEKGRPALHAAIMMDNGELTELLLNAGADINLVYKYPAVFDDTYHILKKHFILLTIAGIAIYKKTRFYMYYVSVAGKKKDYEKNYQHFAKEVALMKITKIIDSNVTYYDYLIKNINKLVPYIRNRNIVDKFSSSEVRNKFPSYANMIIKRYNQSLKRYKLINNTEKVLEHIFCQLPITVIRNLVQYFSDDDLKMYLSCNFK